MARKNSSALDQSKAEHVKALRDLFKNVSSLKEKRRKRTV